MVEVEQVRDGCWVVKLGSKEVGFLLLWGAPSDKEMGYSVDPEYRGRGYMKQALAHVVRTYHEPFKLVIGKSNRASIRVACSCGFLPVSDRGHLVEYRRV